MSSRQIAEQPAHIVSETLKGTNWPGSDRPPRQGVTPVAGQVRVVPARYPGRTLGSVVAGVAIVAILWSVLENPRWLWGIFAEWFFSAPVLAGLGRTLLLTLLGSLAGFTLGTVLAVARVARSPLLAWLSWGFIWLFRSIPLIVLLLILNNLGYLYETIWIGGPFTSITFFTGSTTQLITPFDAAVLGLTLNQGAFAAETIRGGILSVDEASLRPPPPWIFRAGVDCAGLCCRRRCARSCRRRSTRSSAWRKATSNVYILALPELFYTIQIIYRRNLEVIPLLMVATVWYLVILTVLPAIQSQVERHFSRGALRKPQASIFTRLATGRRRATHRPIASLGSVRGGTVRIEGLSKSYGSHRVLDRVSLDLLAGGVTA